MNAIPEEAGRLSINLVQASNPPAEAPIATMEKAFAGGPRGGFTDFDRLFGTEPIPYE